MHNGSYSTECATQSFNIMRHTINRRISIVELIEIISIAFDQGENRTMVYDAAHGGEVGEEGSVRIVAWYKWVLSGKPWEEARENCWRLGGKLFAAVNGTTEQLDFLTAKIGFKTFWTGIHTEDLVIWKDTEGNAISDHLLVWQENQPNYVLEKCCVVNAYNVEKNRIYLDDQEEYITHKSVCDML